MSSGEHLSPERIADYRAHRLRPGEIARAARHLGECEECRGAVLAAGDAERLAGAIEGGSEHLNYEDFEAIAERGMPLDPHLESCETCADEFRDLNEFRIRLGQRRRIRRVWVGAVPVAVAAALLLMVLAKTKPMPSAPVAQTLAALQDGGRTIALDGSGAVHGLEGADPALIEMASFFLRTGQLPSGPDLSGLAGRREVLLGPAGGGPSPQPRSPLGVVASDPRPRFTWTSPPGAGRAVVKVYTTGFEPVAASPELAASEWVCSKTLDPGATYVWTVSVTIAGQRVTAPRSPEPEARFRVATSAERAQLDAARAIRPPSDLAVALVAAKLGMAADADEALAQLHAHNPHRK